MEFKLSKEQRRLKKDILRFAKEQLKDETLSEREGNREFSRSLWDKCGEQRIQGLHVPESFGGMGYDGVQLALAMEALGKGCDDAGLLISLSAQMFGCAAPLIAHGTAAQKEQFLPRLSDGSWIGTKAMSEEDAGSDYDNLATTATADGNGFLINGKKTHLVNAPLADVVLVYAVTDAEEGFQGGITCFVLKTDTPGITIEEANESARYKTTTAGHLTFTDVKASEKDVVGTVGGGADVLNAGLAWERATLSAMHVGRMEHLLEKAIMYARTHKEKGQPIGKKQSVSHKISDMKIRFEVARLLSYKAAWSFDNNQDAMAQASISKLFASESMVQSQLDAGQIFSSLPGDEAGRSLQDANEGTLYAGTAAMQRNAVAKSIGLI